MGFFDKAKPAKRPATSAKLSGGRIHQVKCPWCGFANDFRGVDAGMLVDQGSEFDCDKCRHVMQVVKVEQVKVIHVRQHPTITDPVRGPVGSGRR